MVFLLCVLQYECDVSVCALLSVRSPTYSVIKLSKQLKIHNILTSNESLSKATLDIKQRLCQLDEEQWFGDLWRDTNDRGNKLRTYRLFKKDCRPEPYLKQIISRNKRRNLSRLRCGVLPLHIETGRFHRPPTPLNDRTCPFCTEIENEIHFIFNCYFYEDLRYNLTNQLQADDVVSKLQTVMNSTNSHDLSSTINSMYSRRMYFSNI